ncbi:MAG: beta-ketoacyl-[acyl-carrier-protein] synthase family protein [Candidatus Omnitrophota bacterium]|nr:beta-ketoacyl-[acyl-carrier-protein] synthase family protein [Candidatus Omnitrophota bacterium]
MTQRIVITGLGVVSPLGIGKEAFSKNICSGVSGVRPISLFDTADFDAQTAAEITDFAPEQYVGKKGLRLLDRSTKLTLCAAHLALDDSGVSVTDDNTKEIGLVLASTFGSLSSISNFDREALLEGPQYVNPALFSNTVINSPASQACIKYGIRGFSATISTGFGASLDALHYAAYSIRAGRARIVLAGGVEELCIQIFLGFYKSGLLSIKSERLTEEIRPFDRERNGFVIGEGAVFLVLEELRSAEARGARIYAEMSGYGSGFTPHCTSRYSPGPEGLKRAMRQALVHGKLVPGDIDCVFAAANGSPKGDRFEAEAIRNVFSKESSRPTITAVKSMLGETYSAGGSFAAAAALCALERQMVPPTLHHVTPDPSCTVSSLATAPHAHSLRHVLVNAAGPGGNNSSLVFSKDFG